MSEDFESTLQRLRNELEEIQLDRRLENLIQESNKLFTDSRFVRGVRDMTEMFEQMNESDAFQSLNEGFSEMTGSFNVWTVLFQTLEPIFIVINSLMDVFVGRLMQNLQPALDNLFEVLGRPEIQTAIQFIANSFTNVLNPVITAIANFINLIFGGGGEMSAEEIGGAIGGVIGMIVGAALASYIGMPWLGGIIGAYFGSVIGSQIGLIFEPETSERRADEYARSEIERIRNEGKLGYYLWLLYQQGGTPQIQLLLDQGLITPEEAAPYLAEGGIVMSPTTAWVGEAGTEAILPLEEVFDMEGEDTVQLEQMVMVLESQNRILRRDTNQLVRRRFG